MVNYHKESGKITKKRVKSMEHTLKSKTETGEFNIKSAKEELPD